MPAGTEEEKFDRQSLGLLIERGLASSNGVMSGPIHDLATG